MNRWIQTFFADKHEGFAHLWGAMEDKIPAGIQYSARAAYLYSLHELGAPQMFFDEWMQSLRSSPFAASRASNALEEAIGSGFDAWFLKSGVQISAEQESLIRQIGISRSQIFLSLNAATYRRKGDSGLAMLEKLPLNSPFRPWLAQTVAVGQAKKADLAGAARTLKIFYEPWLQVTKDPRKLALHYMEIARLLYQAGALEGAISYYEKVPNGIPEYLTAREELTWCWLRLGQTDKLRGNLETLTSKALSDQFQPEAYLVRSISNLKLCYYNEVEKDFASFISVNRAWAQKIDLALKASEPPTPRTVDIYSEAAVARVASREAEIAQLRSLSERSISATIPAVGPQKHWQAGVKRLELAIDTAKKSRADEFRRQWKNDRVTLNEAIRKMQFVKVELLSQVSELAARSDGQGDAIVTSASAAQKTPVVSSEQKKQMSNEGEMVFPFDGVVWADEMFRLKSFAKGRCLGQ
ncbi:MAG: hypothetical protein EOP09_03485 [Proteobacteria bacterium]|nr:MAG: hypothetical protein EOP09_03485 [Pseudomonadota bacterium]